MSNSRECFEFMCRLRLKEKEFGVSGGEASYGKVIRRMVKKGSLEVVSTPLVRVVKSPPLPGTRGGDFSTNRNFLYNKCKFTLPRENLFPVSRAFPAPVGS